MMTKLKLRLIKTVAAAAGEKKGLRNFLPGDDDTGLKPGGIPAEV